MSKKQETRTILLKIIDYGDGSKVDAELSLKKAGYDIEVDRRSMLIPSSSLEEEPQDLNREDFPVEQGVHYSPIDPSAWIWLVGSWIAIRVGEHLVDDAYDFVKEKIVELRKKYPKAKIKIIEK